MIGLFLNVGAGLFYWCYMLHLPSASGLLICISGSVSSALLNKGKVFCIWSFVSALPSLSSQGISSAAPGWFAFAFFIHTFRFLVW